LTSHLPGIASGFGGSFLAAEAHLSWVGHPGLEAMHAQPFNPAPTRSHIVINDDRPAQ
jgi:hypothetical protein